MPIYAYRCTACGHSQDALQKISDPVLTTCPACGAEAYAKQLTAAGFQLRGSGWYVTDFRDGNKGKAPAKDGDAAAKPDAPASGADAAAPAKTDAVPAAAPVAPGTAAAPAAAPAPAAKPAAPTPAPSRGGAAGGSAA